jgi:hypothetical protein
MIPVNLITKFGRVGKGSFTPKPLTEPYLNLSIHTALHTHVTVSG